MSECYEYVPHRLLHRRVRDIASGTEGILMAVINENVSDTGIERWMEIAYIRGACGREFTTAVANVEPDPDQPKTAVGRRDSRSA
ncbi:hypothetical protein EF912_31130 [Streptomyces sp. WAC07061]|uniref:hypothetical protein n=1 Tax=Streptomyces sp. WAC07061 TaxID=2487410 RepID=UPI000F77EC30|nr:hypothetical protein [Streptomyces sp. WAC07061]RSS41785.1 hypothetical protein EF912_31130 [Streptomyces sp. WAC07061]